MPDFAKALRGLRPSKPPQRDLFQAENPVTSIGQQLHFLQARLQPSLAESRSCHTMLPQGCEQTTPHGTHYLSRNSYEAGHYHGKVRLDRFSDQDLRFLMTAIRLDHAVPEREAIVFLDTETTGIQGGAGTCPFLVGLGFFEGDEWNVLQYFIRDFDEEPSMLHALNEFLARFRLVITYNGAGFDIPLLESRFVLSRQPSPFGALAHLDMLTSARRLWRNAHGSCRLVALEARIASFHRGLDVPGAMIPRAYFDFLHGRSSPVMRGVFTHNAHDIASLAALTVCACDRLTDPPALLDEPLELYSVGRVFEHTMEWRRSIEFYERALAGDLPDPVRQKAAENLVLLYRRAGQHERALEVCDGLMRSPGFSLAGYEGAARYYERIVHDSSRALEIVEQGLARLEEIPENRRWRNALLARGNRLRQRRL